MGLINVGIHENLTLSNKTKINEHGTLELAIKTVEAEDAVLQAFQNNTTFNSMESSFRFYPPSLTDFDKVKKSAGDIGKELLQIRYRLTQYALLYTTKEAIEAEIGGVKMFEGLGIDPDNMAKAVTMLNKEDFLKKVMGNLVTKFYNFMVTLDAFAGTVTFRQKFLRQSKDKNFAVIPTSTFDVWLESMTIPKAASKVCYSEWETKNGKDNPDPVSSDKSKSTKKDASTAVDLFAAPAGAEKTEGEDVGAKDAGKADENKPDLFAKEEKSED